MLLNANKLSRNGGRDDTDPARHRGHHRAQAEPRARSGRASEILKDLIEALPGAVYTTDAAGLITSYNPAAAEIWGRQPELGQGAILRVMAYAKTGRNADAARRMPDGHRPEGGAADTRRRGSGGASRMAFSCLCSSIRRRCFDASGKLTGAVNMLVDITERKRAEALAERLAAIVESSDDAIVSKDLDGIIKSWNLGAERLFGYAAKEIIGKSIMTLVPPGRHDEERDILDRIRRDEHIQHYETVRQRKDGSQVWVSLTISPLRNANGVVVGASKIARDMTERRRADAHRKILIGELNHRVKNTLAVVQSIASQTLGHASTMEEARAAFGARLINLANAHDVLTRESWAGASLREIVGDAVKPYSGDGSRFEVDGPNVQLSPSAALAISMALHELSTNAAKYGALSAEKGHVRVLWSIDVEEENRRLILRWEESGGPEVIPPKQKGFGSRLIERALASELGGEVRVQYEPAGLVCTINAPMPFGQGVLGGQGEPAESEANSSRRG